MWLQPAIAMHPQNDAVDRAKGIWSSLWLNHIDDDKLSYYDN